MSFFYFIEMKDSGDERDKKNIQKRRRINSKNLFPNDITKKQS